MVPAFNDRAYIKQYWKNKAGLDLNRPMSRATYDSLSFDGKFALSPGRIPRYSNTVYNRLQSADFDQAVKIDRKYSPEGSKLHEGDYEKLQDFNRWNLMRQKKMNTPENVRESSREYVDQMENDGRKEDLRRTIESISDKDIPALSKDNSAYRVDSDNSQVA